MLSVELFATIFLVITLVASLVSVRLKLPYTLSLIIIGIVLVVLSNSFLMGQGIFETAVSQIKAYTLSLNGGQNGGLFVGLVVPPLIFEALTHVRSNDLKAVFRPAMVLATVGVVISTIVGGVLLWKFIGLPIYISFLFAAVISPTDAATVLELFRRLNVPSKLSALLDTEAAFNDATGIIIFTLILGSIVSSKLPIFTAGLNFILVFGGGIAVGLVVSVAGEVLTSSITDRLTETILTITVVYGSYVIATSFGFSGLIAVSVVGLYFGNLTIKTAIRPSNREAIRSFWEIAAFVGNSIAFLYIGLRTDLLKLSQSVELILIAYAAVLVARVVTVYPILTIFDRLSKTADRKIPLKWRNIAMLGGMKGALSIALATSISTSALISSGDIDTISNMVLGVAFLSIVFQAVFLSRYIRRNFPIEQSEMEEELNVRLARAVSAIGDLEKLRMDGKITEGEFASQLENDKDELEDVLAEMDERSKPTKILKTRTNELYTSISDSIRSPRKSQNQRELFKPQDQSDDQSPKQASKDKKNYVNNGKDN
ncbi:MAG TPA: sodium:proton antiporter [Nitrososphaerales archaeon]|nr:sodium:proton antiporter [Nitrososphaerales archaeon]